MTPPLAYLFLWALAVGQDFDMDAPFDPHKAVLDFMHGGKMFKQQEAEKDRLLSMDGGPPRPAAHHMQREADMDDMMQAMMGALLGPGPPGRQVGTGRHGASRGRADFPGGPPPGFPPMVGPAEMEEITFEQIGDGPPTMVISGGGGSGQGGPMGLPPGLPPDLIRALFPGPLSEGPEAAREGNHPFDSPDPIIMELMGEEDDVMGDLGIQQSLRPMIQHASGAATPRDPGSCKQDIAEKCQGARSHIHCLGLNSESISDACRRDVGKSVPFVCSDAISKFCEGGMFQGVRECLGQRLQILSGECRDAVLATRSVVGRAKAERPPAPVERVYPPVPMPHVDGEHECATEGSVCMCRGGHVRYGHPGDLLTEYKGRWSEWRPVEQYIHCDNGVFGDSCPHHHKRCICRERDSPRQPSPGESPFEKEMLMDIELAKKAEKSTPWEIELAKISENLELAKRAGNPAASTPRSLGLLSSSQLPCPGCGRASWSWRPYALLFLVLGGLGAFIAFTNQDWLRMQLNQAVKQRGPESAGLLQGHVELHRHGGV